MYKEYQLTFSFSFSSKSRNPGIWHRLMVLEARASLRQTFFTIIYLPIVYTVFGLILGNYTQSIPTHLYNPPPYSQHLHHLPFSPPSPHFLPRLTSSLTSLPPSPHSSVTSLLPHLTSSLTSLLPHLTSSLTLLPPSLPLLSSHPSRHNISVYDRPGPDHVCHLLAQLFQLSLHELHHH